jgi:hypothetical protein
MPEISQAAIDMIVAEEVSSKTTYIARYQHPEWPGGASGVTVAIGYDLGYSTRLQIGADFGGHVMPEMLAAMQRCAGVHGEAAHALLGQVRSQIVIPWDVAMDVFLQRDVPKWTETCRSHLPHFDELGADCKGALVSLAYNRGASFDMAGDRYAEMRLIKVHMLDRTFDGIPGAFRAMKRLWPNMSGLRNRREHEAALFERGLSAPSAPIPAPPPPSAAHDTRWVQHALNLLHVEGTPLDEDGDYGPRTSAAVLAFQQAHDLVADGIAGRATKGALEAAIGEA